MLTGFSPNSPLLQSYAQEVTEHPSASPVAIVLDASDLPSSIEFLSNEHRYKLDSGFYYFKIEANYVLTRPYFRHDLRLFIQYSSDTKKIQLYSEIPLNLNESVTFHGKTLDSRNSLVSLLNELPLKVLYEDGLSYSAGLFYRIRLPSEQGFKLEAHPIGATIFEEPSLLQDGLDEKGELSSVQPDAFPSNSIFKIIDSLRSVKDRGTNISDYGPFFNYIPDVDLILCTDMSTEPADFILSSKSRLIFVHAKCGKAARRPLSPAGAISEVGAQAIKNIAYLISHDESTKPPNWNLMDRPWPSPKAKNKLTNRLRLLAGESADARLQRPNCSINQLLEEAWTTIAARRTSYGVEKELWLVIGNNFSKKHFCQQMLRGRSANGESLQAFQELENLRSVCANFNVRLRVFVSP